MPTTLQIVSDVHLELRPKGAPEIRRDAPNLALLGDIGKPHTESYQQFIEEQAGTFDKVFVVMGNHEYYHQLHTVDEILANARSVCAEYPNVHLLEREAFDLTDLTTLLGCTLWSEINDNTTYRLADFRRIAPTAGTSLDGDTYRDWHARDVTWLYESIDEVQRRERKAIVLTHHGPLDQMNGKYVGSDLSSGFTTDLSEELCRAPVVALASGHVHSNVDICVNRVRSVSNAMGYPNEAAGYKECVVLQVP